MSYTIRFSRGVRMLLQGTAMCVAMAFSSAILQAQSMRSTRSVTVTQLAAPNATLAEDFTWIESIRELRDGRVLVTDDRDARVAVADFVSGRVSTVGRKGDGPGEYRQVGRLWPLGGDSTLMSVPYGGRWLVLAGAKVVETMGAGALPIRETGMGKVLGADAHGEVAVLVSAANASHKRGASDSMVVVRVNRKTAHVDSAARITPEIFDENSVAPEAESGGVPNTIRTYHVALKARDETVLFPDGVLAVVRGQPFRVDWCVPEKACLAGPPLNVQLHPITERDKRAYLKRTTALSAWPRTDDPSQVVGWPDAIPAFIDGGGPDEGVAWAEPHGRVVIERALTADSPLPLYDVVDHDGKRVAIISVNLNQRIVGFGSHSLYTTETDSDGLQHLQRHAWN